MISYSIPNELASKAIARRELHSISSDIAIALWERDGGGDIYYGRPDHHTLSVYVAGGRGVKSLNGARSQESGRTGLFCVMPAAEESNWTNSDYVSMLHIYFSTDAFKRVTGSDINFDRSSLYRRDQLMFGLVSSFVLGLNWNDRSSMGALDHAVFALMNRLASYGSCSQGPNQGRQLSTRERDLLLQFVNSNLDTKLDVSRIAEALGLSPRSVSRRIKATFGVSPHQFVLRKKVDQAVVFIESGESLVNTSILCGFSSQSHMTHQFRRLLGVTPSQLIRLRRR